MFFTTFFIGSVNFFLICFYLTNILEYITVKFLIPFINYHRVHPEEYTILPELSNGYYEEPIYFTYK